MAGGRVETDPEKLAGLCESFQVGVKKLYESGPTKGDMWFYELPPSDRLRGVATEVLRAYQR